MSTPSPPPSTATATQPADAAHTAKHREEASALRVLHRLALDLCSDDDGDPVPVVTLRARWLDGSWELTPITLYAAAIGTVEMALEAGPDAEFESFLVSHADRIILARVITEEWTTPGQLDTYFEHVQSFPAS